jgi:hypothetical protein
MSFDIFFQPCRFDTEPVEVTNEFTGKTTTERPSIPLSAAELAAVRSALDRPGVSKPDRDDDTYSVDCADGGSAQVFAADLQKSCMFAVYGLTPELVSIMFDVLRAANWVMIPAMEDLMAIAASPDSVQGAPDDFLPVVVCSSATELSTLLIDGFDAWKRYRDRIFGRPSDPPAT